MTSWLALLDKDVLIAIIGLVGALAGGLVVSITNTITGHRSNLTHAYNELTQAQGKMQEEIDAQDEKLKWLFDENRKLRREEHELEDRDLERTRYLRELMHWLDGLCQTGEIAYTRSHPKPHLPDGMRPDFPRLER
jgi:cell shape-determining protein MreC